MEHTNAATADQYIQPQRRNQQKFMQTRKHRDDNQNDETRPGGIPDERATLDNGIIEKDTKPSKRPRPLKDGKML